ncbi:hypothetical protein TSAR_011807 [Trichomalopsis sarcophagae]|uniref:Uncharacterized protein n=1 Tax=Trichomalopsis sarcophagae TaxID=543379 RepID=A0A232F5L6_9HYME|nr:hypothetical protein TSAR_011807 [Trichomalopsis sarcophagae]
MVELILLTGFQIKSSSSAALTSGEKLNPGTPGSTQGQHRIRVAQNLQNKPTLNEEFKRNLSLIAKSIASQLLVCSNPNSSLEQRQASVNELLSRISKAPQNCAPVEAEKPKEDPLKGQTCDEGFQQVMLDRLTHVINGINALKDEVKEVSKETRTIKSMIQRKGDVSKDPKVISCKQLADKYSYNIPLATVEEFERFDKELGDTNSSLREDVIAVLPSGIDGGLSISKCIVKMLKMFITKEVAVQYTAVKQAKGKRIMIVTNLFNCMEAIIKERRSLLNLTTTDKDLSAGLSVVMTNALHWNKRQPPTDANRNQSSLQLPMDQDSSSQGELLATLEVTQINEGDPLFHVQYLD